VVTVLCEEFPPGMKEPETAELRRAGTGSAAAAADLLRDGDVALVPAPGAAVGPDWIDAHLRVLLSGNDMVTVGGPAFGLTTVARGIDGSGHQAALAKPGNIGFTCDMLRACEPAGTVQDWWAAAARGARWISVPAARAAAPEAEVVHLHREEDCESVLERLAAGAGGTMVVVDHAGLPAFPLLADAARAERGTVHVVGPEWLEAR
jgi:hypothetical protein